MKSEKNKNYIPVIGLEVHAQLSVNSKMFAPEAAAYGALPNTLVSAISLAHPGTLPTINKKAIEYAIKLGLACKSTITRTNYFARKNYFYPDLPKGYQITQDKTPICQGGHITITSQQGLERNIELQRIHIEEDAGKSIHDMAIDETLLDFNRAGVALIEIVTRPDIQSPEEAYAFLTELRRLVRYLEICDGNMEEGSLRCDANISVMPKDATTFGQRVEIKNMNSIKNVQLAIEHEIERQIEVLEKGGHVIAETRGYDAPTGKTISQRTKESALDYRYFIEPDLPPLVVTEQWIEQVKKSMPLLPREYRAKFIEEYQISAYAASVLTETKELALFFEELCKLTSNYTAAANWLMGPVKAYLNELNLPLQEFPLNVATLAALIELVEKGQVSFSTASQQLFPALLTNINKTPLKLATELNLLQETNTDALEVLVEEVINLHPDKVLAYKNGKKGILGMLMGEIMQKSQGKAAPALVSNLLKEKLES
jgi:aspartyl-tRNA(Asn)/glutamyl-tRNA(Gln) amidotransferase subunit B